MHYFPILKAKQGEVKALVNLAPTTKGQIWPILQVPPPNLKRDKTKAIEHHTASAVAKIASRLKALQGIRYFLDPVPGQLAPHLLPDLLTQIAQHSNLPGPVLDLDGGDEFLRLYRQEIGEPSFYCLRLPADITVNINIVTAIRRALTRYSLAPENGVLLLDMDDVSHPATNITIYANEATTMFRRTASIPFVEQVLAAGAFPQNIPNGTPSWVGIDFPRREFQLWNAVAAGHPSISYSDYATANPSNAPAPSFPGVPKVRYTEGNRYVLIKGVEVGVPPDTMAEQYHRVSNILTAHKAYTGPAFSWGDGYINNCCNPASINNGSRTTWVQVNTNHHIEYVVRSLLPPLTTATLVAILP